MAAASGDWKVRVIDLSGAAYGDSGDDDTVEEVGGFLDLAHANAYARAYVRDSVERCRVAGQSGEETLRNWFAFGEDAQVVDAEGNAGAEGWKSSTELEDFAASPATPMERDWRAIDPRRLVSEDEFGLPDEEDGEEDEEA